MTNLRTATINESAAKCESDLIEKSAVVSKLEAELEKLKDELNVQWRREITLKKLKDELNAHWRRQIAKALS